MLEYAISGHFLLTELLLEKLEKSEDGRVVNVSALLNAQADSVDFDVVNDKKKFGFLKPNNRSKLAQVGTPRLGDEERPGRGEGTHL